MSDVNDPLFWINQHYENLQAEARKKRLDNLRTMFAENSIDIDDVLKERSDFRRAWQEMEGPGIGSQKIGQDPGPRTAPKWGSIDEMMRDLKNLPKHQPKPAPPVKDKASRIQEIEDELDIIRGVKPTPKGYKVDPSKVKSLMTELKQLKRDA